MSRFCVLGAGRQGTAIAYDLLKFANPTEVIIADIDTEEDHLFRRNWGLFRDRRTDLYNEILSLEGKIKD